MVLQVIESEAVAVRVAGRRSGTRRREESNGTGLSRRLHGARLAGEAGVDDNLHNDPAGQVNPATGGRKEAACHCAWRSWDPAQPASTRPRH
ncbi:hypothetical protein GCM10009677_37500 [Sphaerisporangium rubeum]